MLRDVDQLFTSADFFFMVQEDYFLIESTNELIFLIYLRSREPTSADLPFRLVHAGSKQLGSDVLMHRMF